MNSDQHALTTDFARAGEELRSVVVEVSKTIVGQANLVEAMLLSLLSDGHLLIEGVPGLAKTRTVRSFSEAVGGSWNRVQFTPDLVPADLVGTRLWLPDKGEFTTELGPLMANFVLADEINRAPAKVQSALLEAMEERQVTIGGATHPLPRPFLVLATMNPVENEGTYALPEAQMDRFLFKVEVGYPSQTEELEIVRRSITGTARLVTVFGPERVRALQQLRNLVHVDRELAAYAVAVVTATRDLSSMGREDLAPYVELGAGVRASLAIVAGAQARALLDARRHVVAADIAAVAPLVLSHRLSMSYRASADGVRATSIVDAVLAAVPRPRSLS
jgi:MoxR-like ATPase